MATHICKVVTILYMMFPSPIQRCSVSRIGDGCYHHHSVMLVVVRGSSHDLSVLNVTKFFGGQECGGEEGYGGRVCSWDAPDSLFSFFSLSLDCNCYFSTLVYYWSVMFDFMNFQPICVSLLIIFSNVRKIFQTHANTLQARDCTAIHTFSFLYFTHLLFFIYFINSCPSLVMPTPWTVPHTCRQ